jgi:hypothetical protein
MVNIFFLVERWEPSARDSYAVLLMGLTVWSCDLMKFVWRSCTCCCWWVSLPTLFPLWDIPCADQERQKWTCFQVAWPETSSYRQRSWPVCLRRAVDCRHFYIPVTQTWMWFPFSKHSDDNVVGCVDSIPHLRPTTVWFRVFVEASVFVSNLK